MPTIVQPMGLGTVRRLRLLTAMMESKTATQRRFDQFDFKLLQTTQPENARALGFRACEKTYVHKEDNVYWVKNCFTGNSLVPDFKIGECFYRKKLRQDQIAKLEAILLAQKK